jgi:sugar diacid utilization regulator
MSVVVPITTAEAVEDLDLEGRSSSYREAIEAFGDIALALRDGTDRDELLHLIARKMCELVGVQRASVYLRDERSGLYRGQVGHPITANGDRLIKRLVGGVAADRFTQEIVKTRQPVVIRDAIRDGRAVRSTMRNWNVRSMMGVPMVLRDEVIGLFFLDSEEVAHPFDQLDQELALAFARLAAVAISQAEMMSELRASHDTVARKNQALRQAAAVDDRFTGLVINGGSLRDVAEAVTDLTGKPCAIFDPNMRRRLTSTAGEGAGELARLEEVSADPELAAAIAAVKPASPSIVGPIARLGIQHRLLVTPVTARDTEWAVLVMLEQSSRFRDYDALISRRVAGIIALEMSAERRAAAAEWNARSSLAAQLLRGSRDNAAVERRADFLGVALDRPHALCLVGSRGEAEHQLPDAEQIAEALAETMPDLSVLSTATAEGIALIVELPEASSGPAGIARLKAAIEETRAKRDPDGRLVVGISGTCAGAADFPRAYEQARQVLTCLDVFCAPDSAPVLTADDLGPGRVLLSSSAPEEMMRFAEETIGPLLADCAPPELLETLVCFFECARSVRRSAAQLEVHENTIRYRLGKIQELTGLDMGSDSDAQLSAQVALLVLRLQGRLPQSAPAPEPDPA